MSVHPNPLQFAAGLTRGAPLPSRRHEAWKYSDLLRVLRELPPGSPAAEPSGQGPFAGLAGRELVFVNGRGPETSAILRQAQDAGFSSDKAAEAEAPPEPNVLQAVAGGPVQLVSPHAEPVEARGRATTLSGTLAVRFISNAQG
ncbi:MAG: hypothetical protein KY449_11465, partial [Proteobacteria bacterium]|nr:hypothetical protein [Pseudomonadota bacterium]